MQAPPRSQTITACALFSFNGQPTLAVLSGALVVLLRKPARRLRPWDEPGAPEANSQRGGYSYTRTQSSCPSRCNV
eukprot:141851-Pleurochrysis_carterae.AAC.1